MYYVGKMKRTGEFVADIAFRSQVKYFKQRRVMEWKKQKAYEKLAAEGAVGMPPELAIPSGAPTQSSRTQK